MRTMTAVLMMSLATFGLKAQNDQKAVEKTITNYVKGADQRSTVLLEANMDVNFRSIANTGDKLWISDRSSYLQMIKDEKIGGDKRKIEFGDIVFVDDLNATAEVKLNGAQADFHNLIALVKVKGEWKIIQDLVKFSKKEG